MLVVADMGLTERRWLFKRRVGPADLHGCAPVGPGEVALGAHRKRGEKQSSREGQEDSKRDLKHPEVWPHFYLEGAVSEQMRCPARAIEGASAMPDRCRECH